mmetsp:Transcript_16102/g.34810  ORF Transcript_16102/g.34810 Transcript_16102/m.34810 type:complete len:82 (+) Transcript_16102:84-329(+)
MKSFIRFALLLLSTQLLVSGMEARPGDDNANGSLSKDLKNQSPQEPRRARYLGGDEGLHDGEEAHRRRMQRAPQDSLAFAH